MPIFTTYLQCKPSRGLQQISQGVVVTNFPSGNMICQSCRRGVAFAVYLQLEPPFHAVQICNETCDDINARLSNTASSSQGLTVRIVEMPSLSRDEFTGAYSPRKDISDLSVTLPWLGVTTYTSAPFVSDSELCNLTLSPKAHYTSRLQGPDACIASMAKSTLQADLWTIHHSRDHQSYSNGTLLPTKLIQTSEPALIPPEFEERMELEAVACSIFRP
jgi:hypothetical protein